MLIINCQNIKKYHGAQLVLKNVSLEVRKGERIGLIGPNGSGKSTLLQIIAKQHQPDGGLFTLQKGARVGYLTQVPGAHDSYTVQDVLASSFRDVLDYRRKMAELEEQMAQADLAHDPKRMESCLNQYASLQEKFEREGGYEMDARIELVANGLKIPKETYERSYASLSGGEKTRISLAAELIGQPDLLLLDEPTNHLDLPGVEWLEEYLSQYKGACVIVSHDRYFLDRVVTKIIELEDGESYVYPTNYTGYMKEKEERLLQQFSQYQEQQKKIKKIKETIKQLQEWGRNGDNEKFFKRAASMQKALDRMETIKKPVLERKGADFELKPLDRSGKKVVSFEELRKGYGGKEILQGAAGDLQYGEKVIIVGQNGAGKSTLFKLILGEEEKDAGILEVGARVEIGYLAQQETPSEITKTVLAYFSEEAGLEQGEARYHLARYSFYGPDVFKSVQTLSGGEWTRLRLALLMLRKPNMLLLDEPTNHLDIPSREALEEALEEFTGTLLAISHDRYFINRLAGKVWELDQGKITVYLGNFDEYKEKSRELRKQLQDQEDPAAGRPSDKKEPGGLKHKPSFAQKKSPAREPDNKGLGLEQRIHKLEQKLKSLDDALHSPEEGNLDIRETDHIWREREEVRAELDILYEQWLEAEESY